MVYPPDSSDGKSVLCWNAGRIKTYLESLNLSISNSKILILGATTMQNSSRVVHSQAARLAQKLQRGGANIDVIDPLADPEAINSLYGIRLKAIFGFGYDVVIFAVNHLEFGCVTWEFIQGIANADALIFDSSGTLGCPPASGEKQFTYLF